MFIKVLDSLSHKILQEFIASRKVIALHKDFFFHLYKIQCPLTEKLMKSKIFIQNNIAFIKRFAIIQKAMGHISQNLQKIQELTVQFTNHFPARLSFFLYVINFFLESIFPCNTFIIFIIVVAVLFFC